MPSKVLVLIIEDDTFSSKLMGEVLSEEGFSFEVAVNGKEGLEKTKAVKPDVILLDLLLPVMNGFEFLAAMKKDLQVSSIPVIILSNLDSKNDIEKGLHLGAADYLVKSQSNVDQIVATVKRAINK